MHVSFIDCPTAKPHPFEIKDGIEANDIPVYAIDIWLASPRDVVLKLRAKVTHSLFELLRWVGIYWGKHLPSKSTPEDGAWHLVPSVSTRGTSVPWPFSQTNHETIVDECRLDLSNRQMFPWRYLMWDRQPWATQVDLETSFLTVRNSKTLPKV